ncbi:MAG TPA: hypothetical protein VM510_10390 [Caulifigura sp.]|nr:hypothetical protein [Caulifigura sp.]
MAVSRLREQVSDWKQLAEFDQPARLLRNIALSGCESKNGYRYSETALKLASRLYDQKPVFLDHADKRSEQTARSTRDLVGSIVNPRCEEGRLRGDVRVLDTESGRTFLALVEGNTPGVGMSHVVLAQRSVDGATVERIEDVISVDVVVRPATTSTFRESDENPPERPAVEFREVAEAEPAAAESVVATDSTSQVAELLPRVIRLLEALLEKADGAGGDGTGVQEVTRNGREAAVSSGRRVEEGAGRSRIISVSRREHEPGCSRGAFVAAVRGR